MKKYFQLIKRPTFADFRIEDPDRDSETLMSLYSGFFSTFFVSGSTRTASLYRSTKYEDEIVEKFRQELLALGFKQIEY